MKSSGFERGKAIFLEEARELVDDLENLLLELESVPDDPELINRTFRVMHTLKGSGAMFGFNEIASLTHEMETIFDLVRTGKWEISTELIGLTLLVHDRLGEMLQQIDRGETVEAEDSAPLIKSLRDFLKTGSSAPGIANPKPLNSPPLAPREQITKPAPKEQAKPPVMEQQSAAIEKSTPVPSSPVTTENISESSALEAKKESVKEQEVGQEEGGEESFVAKSYRIIFKPKPYILASGTNPLLLLRELQELGECTYVAQTDQIPLLDTIDAESCLCYWDVTLLTNQGKGAIRDVFIFVEDDCELHIDEIDFDEDEAGLKEKRLGEILMQQGNVDAGHIASALSEQKVRRQRQQDREKQQSTQAAVSTIRVPFWKLNTLVDLVGELVTVQARLSSTASAKAESKLTQLAEEVERLTADLRDTTMGIRMLPIGNLFSRFKRLVRDLNSDLGIEANLTMEGDETELDKSVIEQLNDPLVHIIRNCMGHGIETPEERLAAGKTRAGNIHLSARHVGANVVVQIKDDGKGLDAEAIRRKAIERGLILPESEMTENEMHNLIFAPGFSTSKIVNKLSGRGVGMDVVKKNIESLSGQVSIQSKTGKGTAIIMKLPLTLAIIDGLLVKIGGQNFVIPLASVDEVVELSTEEIERKQGGHVARVRDELVPYLYLKEHFNIKSEPTEIQQVVVVEEDVRVGFVVDYVVGEYQTVIKNLGVFYKDIIGLSGATVLGDGSVALILDVLSLIQVSSTHPVSTDL